MSDVPVIMPARGGSKGVPGKNLQTIAGVPLLVRAIRTCQDADRIGPVYVPSDCPEIREVAKAAGAIPLVEPAELAGDFVLSSTVLLWVIENFLTNHDYGAVPEVFCHVQCTAPLMEPEDIDGCVNRLLSTEADLAIAASPTDALMVEECGEYVAGCGWSMGPGPVTLRQQRADCWEIAGSVWAIRTAPFQRRKRVYCHRCVVHEVPERLEIDTPADLARAVRRLTQPPESD